MRLGVIADVHGNALALEAVLGRLERLSLDMTINLGDCASGPLWPAEATALLRGSGFQHVRGNHDRAMTAADSASLGQSDAFAWQALDPMRGLGSAACLSAWRSKASHVFTPRRRAMTPI